MANSGYSSILPSLSLTRLCLHLIICFILSPFCQSNDYTRPHYYKEQLIYHEPTSNPATSTDTHLRGIFHCKTWRQRYYVSDSHFKRPGPIFLIMGGEEEITPEDGILYPFVSEHLAPYFSGLVIQPEHRFYGDSQPLGSTLKVTNEDLIKLMNPEQAMWDAIKLVDFIKSRYGCSSTDPKHFCPVIAVGGSYPGFLAAMMRFIHPEKIDASYAASAPMQFYAQKVDQSAYYDHITAVAGKSSPGCSDSVKTALMNILDVIAKEVISLEEASEKMGICFIPDYMKRDKTTFVNEVMMIVGYTFANLNMANYPPDNTTSLYQACQIFQDGSLSFFDQILSFFQPYYSSTTDKTLKDTHDKCFDITKQLPSGPNATISSGDWSGVGSQWSGNMWDFQTCSFLIEKIGFSKQSMFPPRTWTLEWLTDHCQNRFQVVPQPDAYATKWGFEQESIISRGASRILFTNGLNDGWSVSGIQSNLSETVLALNFENGAHHSDLSRQGPSDRDTEDIKEGLVKIQSILDSFLQEARLELLSSFDHLDVDEDLVLSS